MIFALNNMLIFPLKTFDAISKIMFLEAEQAQEALIWLEKSNVSFLVKSLVNVIFAMKSIKKNVAQRQIL